MLKLSKRNEQLLAYYGWERDEDFGIRHKDGSVATQTAISMVLMCLLDRSMPDLIIRTPLGNQTNNFSLTSTETCYTKRERHDQTRSIRVHSGQPFPRNR